MIDIRQYIESGILNDYCLGLLNEEEKRKVEGDIMQYPELKIEVDLICAALDGYMMFDEVQTSPGLNERIWATLHQVSREESMQLGNLPLLTSYSDKDQWLRIVKPLLPAALNQDIFALIVKDDHEATQTLLWSRVNIPDEVHDDLMESFIILEGECECFIDDQVVKLGPGGYLEIPLHAHHDVKLLTPTALAIVQRRKIA